MHLMYIPSDTFPIHQQKNPLTRDGWSNVALSFRSPSWVCTTLTNSANPWIMLPWKQLSRNSWRAKMSKAFVFVGQLAAVLAIGGAIGGAVHLFTLLVG